MIRGYAKDQPPGFNNRIERVAIVGASGQLGSYITAELLKTGKHTVTALSRRSAKPAPLPAGLLAAEIDYDNPASIVSALKGQDMLIITLSVSAPEGTHSTLVQAAADAKVPFVMPNSYGFDWTDEPMARESLVGTKNREYCDEIERLGVSSWVAIVCGLWYEYSVVLGPLALGFDLPEKKLTLLDDGDTKLNMTTWQQVARAVARLAGLKMLPEDESDDGPTLSMFRNKPAYVSSFLISQKDIFDSWKRVTGQTDDEWTVEREGSQERYKRGQSMMQEGNRTGASLMMFSRQFFPCGGGDFESKHVLANALLELPQEDLDECTQAAKEMFDGGYQNWVWGRFSGGGGNTTINRATAKGTE